jgi:hypothetical protein
MVTWKFRLLSWLVNRLRVDLHEGCKLQARNTADEAWKTFAALQAEVARLRPRPGSGQRTFWAVFEPGRGIAEPTPIVFAGSERDVLALATLAMRLRGFEGAALEAAVARLLYGRITTNINFYQARAEQSLGELQRAQKRLDAGK